ARADAGDTADTPRRMDHVGGRLDHGDLRVVLRAAQGDHSRLRGHAGGWLYGAAGAGYGRGTGGDRLFSRGLAGGTLHGVGALVRHQPGPVGLHHADPGAGLGGRGRRAGHRHSHRHSRGQVEDGRGFNKTRSGRGPDNAGFRVPGPHRGPHGARRTASPHSDGRLRHAACGEAHHAGHPAGPQRDRRGRAGFRGDPLAEPTEGGTPALPKVDHGRGEPGDHALPLDGRHRRPGRGRGARGARYRGSRPAGRGGGLCRRHRHCDPGDHARPYYPWYGAGQGRQEDGL
ncbi:MAG: hypothetical protein AVDCRST_MAG05-4092, partial [uncultured Rubrobacteraceae bacterium]